MAMHGHDPERIKSVINDLIEGKIIDQKYRDHILIGNLQDRRESHTEPDWLLIYRIDEPQIIFERIGTHADLFK